ncbi:ribbon-helix-helix domain-containing protein [Mangrovicella endophytica]|uniref:ribbon-helix-helix domain-containing protein n=1 Tax=Mangrovicella endophytica TaxID=2066697 RepID=UPI000C9EC6B5|nr:ribbon-helix-helix domain-containing protein [Mangrovicella endophytica]
MIVKRSIAIRGHRTSISIEEPFWAALRAMADRQAISLAGLVARIDARRDESTNLSSAIRVAVLTDALERQPAADLGERTSLQAAADVS